MKRSLAGSFWMFFLCGLMFVVVCWLFPACGLEVACGSPGETGTMLEGPSGEAPSEEVMNEDVPSEEVPGGDVLLNIDSEQSTGDDIASVNNISENNTAVDESPEIAANEEEENSNSGISEEEFDSDVSEEPFEGVFELPEETAEESSEEAAGESVVEEAQESVGFDEPEVVAEIDAATTVEEAQSESVGFDESAVAVSEDVVEPTTPTELTDAVDTVEDAPSESVGFDEPEVVEPDAVFLEYGGGLNFKVPVPPGYNWEVTQSWGEHCGMCSDRYTDWDYCGLTHNTSCCRYSWDFNMPGYFDEGKPVVASADGVVKKVGYTTGWGYHVVIDHGHNLCSRYAHLLEGSTDHLEEGSDVCQGLQVGEIGESGNAEGPHLHYQFEDCTTAVTLPIGFEDGNGVPVCTRGEDRYDADGYYSFLRLINMPRLTCEDPSFVDVDDVPEGKWREAACGDISGCPLRPEWQRMASHAFSDYYYMSEREAQAASYLWNEAAIDSKNGGQLDPFEYVRRGEVLKVALYLYGMLEWCDIYGPLYDEDFDDWAGTVTACAFRNLVVSLPSYILTAGLEIGFGEAAKYLVRTASIMGFVMLRSPAVGHFPYIPSSDPYYQYVETLYEHGGITENMLEYSASDSLRRGDFVVMAAALSPCFCGSVSCHDGCSCSQETFSCWGPDDASEEDMEAIEITPVEDEPEIVSIESDEEEDDDDDPAWPDDETETVSIESDEDEEEEEDEDEPVVQYDLNLDINCSLLLGNSLCGEGEIEFFINCMVRNYGEEDVALDNMFLQMEDENDAAVCRFTRQEFLRTSSALIVQAEGASNLSSGFSIACSEPIPDVFLEAAFDVRISPAGGRLITYRAYKHEAFDIPDSAFESCENSPFCNPFLEYTVHVEGGDGSLGVLMFGHSPSVWALSPDGELVFHLQCTDLPVAFLASGSGEVHLWSEESYVPSFQLWFPYYGPLTLEPSTAPSTPGGSRDTGARLSGTPFLVRLPAENLL